MKIPREAEGAKLYSDNGAGKAAWYHIDTRGRFLVYTKTSARAKARLTGDYRNEDDAVKAVNKVFE